MRKTHIYIGLALTLSVALAYFFLKEKKTDTIPADKQEKQDAHTNKEVELNEAQYLASGIELGFFEKKNLNEVINTNGYTKLPPQNQADVSVYLGGIIKSILAFEGQYVKKGQVLATIENPEFAKLHEAYLASASNLEFLTAEYERQKTLNEENVNSRKTLQKTKTEYEVEKARYNSLKNQLAMLNLDGTGASVSSVNITSPISGYITEVNIKIGSNTESGKVLFSIVDNTKMHVDLLVYEKDLHRVKEGQTVRFVLTNQGNKEITGKVFSIGKAFENETKSVAVHADILNEDQLLIPGMYVNALIDIGAQAVNSLPVEAVVKADGREFIFVLEEHEEEAHVHEGEHDHEPHEAEKMFHFQRIEVKTGTEQLGFVQVTPLQTLDTNARIVLKGAYYIQSHLLKTEDGAHVH